MRRLGDGQGKHLTGTALDEIHRRISAGETFTEVAVAVECSTKSPQRLLGARSKFKRNPQVRSPLRVCCAKREELLSGLVLGHSFRRTAKDLAHRGSRQGDGWARSIRDRHQREGVLLRSAQPLAARKQREFEWLGSPIVSQRHRPKRIQPCRELAAVSRELNNRPRQSLGWIKPSEVFAQAVASGLETAWAEGDVSIHLFPSPLGLALALGSCRPTLSVWHLRSLRSPTWRG